MERFFDQILNLPSDEPTSGVVISRLLASHDPEDQCLWTVALAQIRKFAQLVDWHPQIPRIIAYSQTLDKENGHRLRGEVGNVLHHEKIVQAWIELQTLHDQESFLPLKDGFGAMLHEWSTNHKTMCFCLNGTPYELFLEFRKKVLSIAGTHRGVHLLSHDSTLVFLFYRPCTHPADLMAVSAAMEIMATTISFRLGCLASQGLQLRGALHYGVMKKKRWTNPKLPTLISETILCANDAEPGEVTITDTAREAILAATDQTSEPGLIRSAYELIMSLPKNGRPIQLIWKP